MATAGVIAAFGVIYANTTLVVGATAISISPDLLPICAAATALVLRRWNLALRAFATLLIELGCACLVGGVMTFALHQLQLGPAELLPGESALLAGLSTVNIATPIVVFAAGGGGHPRPRDTGELGRQRSNLGYDDSRVRLSRRRRRRR